MKNNFKKMMLLFGLILFGLSSKAQNNTLDFDGVNDYVQIADNPSLQFTSVMTIEAELNLDDISGQRSIVTKNFCNNNFSYAFVINNQKLKFAWTSDGDCTSANIYESVPLTDIQSGECIYVAVVFTLNSVDFYLNGSHVNGSFTQGGYSTIFQGTEPLRIGIYRNSATSFTFPFDGKINEVRIWNTARTQQQIVDNMDLNLTGTEAGLVALYNCNQGVAGGNNTGTSTLSNSTSTPGLNGVLTNFSMTGNQSNFVKNPCLNLDCEALDNPAYTQITSNLTISSNAVWSGKYYIANGVTVTVNNGATLDLTNVDLVFGSCAGMNFVNKGNIRANNSVFRSCSIYGTWNGLHFYGTNNEISNNIINECTFKNAEEALKFRNNADALISNNLFSNCYAGIKTFRTNFHHTISGNKFITEEFYPEFSSCSGLISNTSYSIYANNTSFYEPISQNEFINSNDSITAIGFESSFGGGELTNNTFTDLNDAINIISAINNFTIGSNQIVKNTIDGHGIYIYHSFRSLIEINDNILTNHKYGNITENGIYLDKSYYVSISNNQIEGYNTGIYTHNSANLQISNNLITNARNFGIAYDTDVTDFIGKIFITCNEIRMYNLLGTGIFIKDMTWNNLIATNCIFDSKTAIDLVNTTTNSNLFMPKIRNNYLYNYTSIGINIDNYIGNIGSNTALDQGMNTFWSNTMNTATDIQSTNPITTAYNFGVNNISPQVTIIHGEKQYYSTASCANQIEYKEGNLYSLLVEDYNCDNTSFIADLLTGNGGVSSFIDHSISNLAESDNQFMLARVIIGYFDNINDQQFNQILNETDLSNNEELLLKYQYHYKNEDYANAKLAITNFTPTNEREVNLKTVCLIDLKAIEFDWSSISTQEKEALNQIINEKSEFSNVAISLNNHVSNYMPYQVSTLDARDIEISSETINLNSDSETLSIYPSPTNSMITVDIINLNENDEILIYDIKGKLVMNYSISFSTGKLNVNVENFEKGVYFVTINSSTTGTTKKGKFVKI